MKIWPFNTKSTKSESIRVPFFFNSIRVSNLQYIDQSEIPGNTTGLFSYTMKAPYSESIIGQMITGTRLVRITSCSVTFECHQTYQMIIELKTWIEKNFKGYYCLIIISDENDKLILTPNNVVTEFLMDLQSNKWDNIINQKKCHFVLNIWSYFDVINFTHFVNFNVK